MKNIPRYLISNLLMLFCTLTIIQKLNAQNQPNIIIIYTDQQRFNTIHALGNERIITPNLDQLVKNGMAFTQAFVSSPVCAPSRWSLHTGMYTTSHQTYSNHHAGKRPATSLPLELKNKGYKTILVGKNHSFLGKEELDVNERVAQFKNNLSDLRAADKAMDWAIEDDPEHKVTDKAIQELTQCKDKPFFMWLSYVHPHTPYHCPEPYFSMYDHTDIPKPVIEKKGLKKAGKPFRQQYHQINNNLTHSYDEAKTLRMKKTYYGMISMLDYEVGRVINFLKENNMYKNTIIVFTSDHGDYMGDHGLYTKSPALYDCLVHVNLIFSYPGQIQQNQTSDELVSCIDIMPTLLDFVDIPIPGQVQGISLKTLLKGESSKINREYIFAEYGIPGQPISEKELQIRMPDYKEIPIRFSTSLPWEANPVALAGRIRMIRSKSYKLIEEVGGTNEFYDLKDDPHELKNLYGKKKHQSIQKSMLSALHSWKSTLPGVEQDTLPMAEQNFAEYLEKRNKLKNK